jgi:hypothetical protein
MPDTPTYKILNVPLLGRNLAASRTPRLQPSVPAEYADMLSREVEMGEWSVDPETGEPINSKGQTIADHLEFCIKTRPHWLMPAVLEDDADACWLSGNITLQGQRLKQLETFCGSDAAAKVLFAEEAARYGVKPLTTQVGTKPGPDGQGPRGNVGDEGAKKSSAPSPSNPWNPKTKFTPQEADAEKARLIKTLGTKGAASIAKAAGFTIFGAKIA